MRLSRCIVKSRLVCFIFWPFLLILQYVNGFRKPSSRWTLVLIGVFFALVYVPIEGNDATSYQKLIKEYNAYDNSFFFEEIKSVIHLESEFKDFYSLLILWLVTALNLGDRIYFTIAALIYYFVLSGLLHRLIAKAPEGSVNTGLTFILSLATLLNFSAGVNGLRWPLALNVFLLGLYLYIEKPCLKNILLIFSSCMIHFSLYYVFAFFIVYLILKKIWFLGRIYQIIVLILGVIILILSSNGLINFLQFTQVDTLDSVQGFATNENFKSNRVQHFQNWNWYLKLDRYAHYYFIVSAYLLVQFRKQKILLSKKTLQLEFAFIIFLFASVVSSFVVDPISNRYYLIANGVGLIYLFHIYIENKSDMFLKRVSFIYKPFLLLHILILLRSDLYTVNPWFFIGNPLTAALFRWNVGIQTLIIEQFF